MNSGNSLITGAIIKLRFQAIVCVHFNRLLTPNNQWRIIILTHSLYSLTAAATNFFYCNFEKWNNFKQRQKNPFQTKQSKQLKRLGFHYILL